MRGDYGYMEEGALGKPYNLRLLKRLAPYALPYKKVIALGLLLSLLITLLNLTPPMLLKIALDRYILSPETQEAISHMEPEELAEAIVTHREKSGFFNDPEDLLKVQGMTKAIYEKMNPQVGTEGDLFCVPKEGSEDDEEEEEEPLLSPSKC